MACADMHDLHKRLETREVAALMHWPVWKARRWLKGSGSALKPGGRYYTTLARLLEHFPDVAGRYLAQAEARLSWAHELARQERRINSAERRIRALEGALRSLRRERRNAAQNSRRGRKMQVCAA